MEPFDLLGPLPEQGDTLVLEASAGTGKTFALAGLVTRYLADGEAMLDEMLMITFNKAASRELRERVRGQIVAAVAVLDGHKPPGNELEESLLERDRDQRRTRLRDAVAGFDEATIVTTDGFCGLVLKSLGIAGDSDAGARLVESLDDLVGEIVNDLYLGHFDQQENDPLLTPKNALELAKAIVGDPCSQLRPLNPDPGTEAHVRKQFAEDVGRELAVRKRRTGVFGYDDLLLRLAKALEHADSPARDRMQQRWRIVMVDEFQDTDPLQWQVLESAFTNRSTLILIGDPKQAIYAFRGGDIHTYLRAARTAGERKTLAVNYRSDKVLVDSLHAVLRGAALGHRDIVVPNITAHREGHRLHGAPHNAPFRLRVVKRHTVGCPADENVPIAALRQHIPDDLAADIGALIASPAKWGEEKVKAGHIAVVVERHEDARACREALARAGIPAVYSGDRDVFSSDAAKEWLCLLEAFEQPHRTGLVRAAACTMFFGHTADDLATEGDALTDRVATTLREWADHARLRGMAAVAEAAQLAGMGRRVLRQQGGERHMTDVAHIGQLLHEMAYRERMTPPALRDWLHRQCRGRRADDERNRRLDSDAAAVQIMTVFVAKGLQFPIVYLPFAFNRFVRTDDILLYHEQDETRCLFIGGKKKSADRAIVEQRYREEAARNDIRLTYVALTRAQSQVVAWWAPSRDEVNGGLSRLLRDRSGGDTDVQDSCTPGISDDDARAVFKAWEVAGGPVVEESVIVEPAAVAPPASPTGLRARHFHRDIDTTWRRTSYSGLIRAVETTGVTSEPEVAELDDESEDLTVTQPPVGADVPSPMAELPTGARFGSLVHAVLETTDPFSADLQSELAEQIRVHSQWWPVDVPADDLAAAMVPMHDTPLGPLTPGLTLRQVGLRDRLRELDFEFPLAGGDVRGGPRIELAQVGRLLHGHLPADDPLSAYADRLISDTLGGQSLRGYLTGSVDAVLRVPGPRYLVVDYKTNWLGDPGGELTAADYSQLRMAEAMMHSDYPLQALLYLVALHRFLRWRQPEYDPQQHLGGVLYLFVRGMCGQLTPVMNGHPAGVFSWQPPAGLITALSDLLDAGRQAA